MAGSTGCPKSDKKRNDGTPVESHPLANKTIPPYLANSTSSVMGEDAANATAPSASVSAKRCTKCGSTDLERKGKDKSGKPRFGSICRKCKAAKEQHRYQRKRKTEKRRKYMLGYDVQKCKVTEAFQDSPTPDGLINALRTCAYNAFLADEEVSDETDNP